MSKSLQGFCCFITSTTFLHVNSLLSQPIMVLNKSCFSLTDVLCILLDAFTFCKDFKRDLMVFLSFCNPSFSSVFASLYCVYMTLDLFLFVPFPSVWVCWGIPLHYFVLWHQNAQFPMKIQFLAELRPFFLHLLEEPNSRCILYRYLTVSFFIFIHGRPTHLLFFFALLLRALVRTSHLLHQKHGLFM